MNLALTQTLTLTLTRALTLALNLTRALQSSVQACSACLAFPYMVDAHLLVEAVMDATKGGEEGFVTWTTQRTEQLRALHCADVRAPHANKGKPDAEARAADASGLPLSAGRRTESAASDPLKLKTAPVAGLAAPVDAGPEPADAAAVSLGSTAITHGGGEPMTLSHLAACHVGDVLRRAGVQPPPWRTGSGPCVGPFGCPPLE